MLFIPPRRTKVKRFCSRFRWVTCQLDELAKCLTIRKLKQALISLPKTLEETYDRILCSIPEFYRQYAQNIFIWLTFSKRLLRLDEVAEVTAFVIEENSFDAEEILADPEDILTICSSLISFVDANDDVNASLSYRYSAGNSNARPRTGRNSFHQYVVLSHLSVKDYFLSDRIAYRNVTTYSLRLVPSSLRIAQSCLIYLLYMDRESASGVATTANFNLAEYSARFWALHLEDVPETERFPLYGLTARFLMDQGTAFKNCKPLITRFSDGIDLSPLSYVAKFSLADIVKLLLDAGASNLDGALGEASLYGQIDTVKLLLDAGASNLDEALKRASMHGKSNTVKLLLDAGASNLDEVFELAVISGEIDTVKQLLDAGASDLHRALSLVSGCGYIDIAKLLLDAGASNLDEALDMAVIGDINTMKLVFHTRASGIVWPLIMVAGGHINIVKLLLDAGASDLDGALGTASESGQIDIVKLLLDAGASDLDGALGTALLSGQIDIVKLLLDAGASDLGEALEMASESGQIDIVKLLLNAGASDLDRALGMASESGQIDIVKLLLDTGASDLDGALGMASAFGRIYTVKLLLDVGAGNHDEALRIILRDSKQHVSRKRRNDIINVLRHAGARDVDEEPRNASEKRCINVA